jgi:HEAT repeat protein
VAVAGHRGDRAQVRDYLDDDEPAVRAGALRALERAGGLDAHLLAAALEDPAPTVRITALELAASHRDVPADMIAARLDDPDQRVVEAAAWTCGEKVSAMSAGPVDFERARIGEGHSRREGVSPALVRFAHGPLGPRPRPHEPESLADSLGLSEPIVTALMGVARTHADPLCREAAIAALGAIAHPDGLPAVLAGLDDRPEVRRRAVIALAPFDGPEVEAALERAGNDRDKQVRTAAAELRGPQIGATGPDAEG